MIIIKSKNNLPEKEMKNRYKNLLEQMELGLIFVNDNYEVSVVEPKLDKIKAEIIDAAFDWQEIDGEHGHFMVVDLIDVLKIIDKYKSRKRGE